MRCKSSANWRRDLEGAYTQPKYKLTGIIAKANGTIHLRRTPKSPFVQKSQPWANIYWSSGFPKAGIYMKTFKYAKVFIVKYTWKKNKTKQDEDKEGEADRQRLFA